MKNILLIVAGVLFLGQNLLAQDIDYIKNGNFEEQGVWEIFTTVGVEADMTWTFGNIGQAPAAGEGTCLKVSYTDKDYPINQILVQKVYLTVGDTYTFSGAFNDAGTDADVDQAWWQIIIWPTKADISEDGSLSGPIDHIQGGPDWHDGDATILLNHAKGWGVDHFGIGLNTTFADDQEAVYGNKIGLGDGEGQGDTTVYTVPETLYRYTDDFELGAIGDTIEYYVALQFGQWMGDDSGIMNTVAFTLDEFKLMGPKHVAPSAVELNDISKLRAYPNPCNSTLNVECENMIQSLRVNNILGQEVLRMDNVQESQVLVNTSDLTNSIYILTITDETEKTYSRKILVK